MTTFALQPSCGFVFRILRCSLNVPSNVGVQRSQIVLGRRSYSLKSCICSRISLAAMSASSSASLGVGCIEIRSISGINCDCCSRGIFLIRWVSIFHFQGSSSPRRIFRTGSVINGRCFNISCRTGRATGQFVSCSHIKSSGMRGARAAASRFPRLAIAPSSCLSNGRRERWEVFKAPAEEFVSFKLIDSIVQIGRAHV